MIENDDICDTHPNALWNCSQTRVGLSCHLSSHDARGASDVRHCHVCLHILCAPYHDVPSCDALFCLKVIVVGDIFNDCLIQNETICTFVCFLMTRFMMIALLMFTFLRLMELMLAAIFFVIPFLLLAVVELMLLVIIVLMCLFVIASCFGTLFMTLLMSMFAFLGALFLFMMFTKVLLFFVLAFLMALFLLIKIFD